MNRKVHLNRKPQHVEHDSGEAVNTGTSEQLCSAEWGKIEHHQGQLGPMEGLLGLIPLLQTDLLQLQDNSGYKEQRNTVSNVQPTQSSPILPCSNVRFMPFDAFK